MAVKNLEPLGTISCTECLSQATVHQAARGKGRYLYTRCPECKADQRTGRAFQNRLWTQTDWYPGKKPDQPPANVTGAATAPATAKATAPATAGDWSPDDDKPKPATGETTAKPVKQPAAGGGAGAAIFGGLAVLLTGLGLLLLKLRQPQQSTSNQGVSYDYRGY